jgi:hypothetical protein
VDGWRQRLQAAGDVVEKHRLEWRMKDTTTARNRKNESPRVSHATSLAGTLKNASNRRPDRVRTAKRISVHRTLALSDG